MERDAQMEREALAERSGALSWSLSVAIKLVPLVLLPYFMLRRRWTWLLASVALIAGWCLIPFVLVGTRIIDIYEEYWRVFLATSLAVHPQPLDFSLAGTIARLTGTPLTPMLKASAAAMVIGWILQADARRLRTRHGVAFALYSLAIPLLSPQSEVHHLAFMMPAAAISGSALWWDWRHARGALQIATIVAIALHLTATVSPIASGPLFCASMLAFGVAAIQSHHVVDH